MGFNLIQIEMGVSDILPQPGVVAREKLEQDILPVLRRAAKANVRVDLLISPHYMPDWVLQAYPELRQPREGFIQYSLFAPVSLHDFASVHSELRASPAQPTRAEQYLPYE
jgi:hypothetical protein